MQFRSKYWVKSPSWELESTEHGLRDFQILIIYLLILW